MTAAARVAAAALSVATVAAGLAIASPAPAEAARNRPCLTRSEYRRIHHGATVDRVRHIVGARGKVFSSYDAYPYRSLELEFRVCGDRDGFAVMDFHSDDIRTAPMRLDSKWVLW